MNKVGVILLCFLSSIGLFGQELVKDLTSGAASTSISAIKTLNSKLYFGAGPFIFNRDIWSSDGTPDGTIVIKDFENVLGYIHGVSGKYVVFLDVEEGKIPEGNLFKHNTLTGVTSLFGESSQTFGGYGLSISRGDDLFSWLKKSGYGMELWKLNGESNSIELLKDINPGSGDANAFGVGNFQIVFNDKIIFAANDGSLGVELWVSDGTEVGTMLIKDISPDSSNPNYFTRTEEKVFFQANDGTHGDELWITDGSALGTRMVKDINEGVSNGMINISTSEVMAAIGDKVIFQADDGGGGEIWISDGTSEGTHKLKDINPSGGSNANLFYYFNNKVFFTADDGVHGTELWFTNGTDGGTVLIDLVEGSESSDPMRFIDDGVNLYFQAAGKIWRSSGTAATTEPIADYAPSGNLYVMNDHLYFAHTAIDVGRELFRFPINAFSKWQQQIFFPSIPNKTIGDSPFSISATASSDLEIVLTTESNIVELNGLELTLLEPGMVSINANQSGNLAFEAAPTVSQTFCINPAQPAISLSGENLSQPTLTSSAAEGNLWYKDDVLLNEKTSSLNVIESGTYKLQVVIDGCKSELSEGKTILITRVEEGTMMDIHPNPTRGTINVTISEGQIVQIVNSNGVILYDEVLTAGDHQLDISGYPSGVYILKLTSSSSTELKRWVKQ